MSFGCDLDSDYGPAEPDIVMTFSNEKFSLYEGILEKLDDDNIYIESGARDFHGHPIKGLSTLRLRDVNKTQTLTNFWKLLNSETEK